ncbi:MAG TPA: hypothetical protein VM938_02365 [Acidimicrobiales bacterium]|nr:hypothetical protein [Acidimicrobiales bacterium]
METRRWVNMSQPQTLQIAVFLFYINAAFMVLGGSFVVAIGLVLLLANVAAGFGIANEQKWGYGLGIAVAVLPFVLRLAFGGFGALLGADVISLMFDIALVALLLHPQSREYQRIWFR